MAARPKLPVFSGPLNEPIEADEKFFSAITKKAESPETWKVMGLAWEKLPLLLEHYAANLPDEGDECLRWKFVAFMMAVTLGVPGFRVVPSARRKRGRPKKDDPAELLFLLADYEQRKLDGTKLAKKILGDMARSPAWKGRSAGTLGNDLTKARKLDAALWENSEAKEKWRPVFLAALAHEKSSA